MKTTSVIDYIVQRLADEGITDCFGVPGDYAFPVCDSVDRNPNIKWIGCSNELNAANPRIAIGSVGGIQFIRAADPFDVRVAIDCVTDRERVVTRYAETVGDPFISKSLNDIVNYTGRFHKSRSSSFLSQAFEDRYFRKSQISYANVSASALVVIRDCVVDVPRPVGPNRNRTVKSPRRR